MTKMADCLLLVLAKNLFAFSYALQLERSLLTTETKLGFERVEGAPEEKTVMLAMWSRVNPR